MTRHDTLLLACGDAKNRSMLRSILGERFNLLEASNTQQALLLLEQNISCIAAVILDITVQQTVDRDALQSEGYELLHQIPVIVITEDDLPDTLSRAFDFGAADVIPRDYDAYAMYRRIENIIELHLHKLQLEVLVEEQADILRRSNDHMVDALSSIIEYRSVESGQHILRIRHFTKLLLDELRLCCPEYQLTDRMIQIISSASALHDVGKIAIPDAILTKPGKLTEEEREIMKSHAVTGCHILETLGNVGNQEYLRYAYNICRYHHERWDGSGYPDGLAGEDIPICAQVVGLADVYDALTTKRVYKEAFPFEVAVNMILKGECGVFSPKLLECFKHVVQQYETLAKAYADGLAPENENFDTALPAVETSTDQDAMARTWAKYQALVHYANAFLLELDMDNGLFHLIYNPFPELISFENVSSFGEIERLIMDKLVMPEEQEKMRKLIHEDIAAFLKAGLRRVNHYFTFRSSAKPEGEPFEVSFLRINPMESNRNTLAVLCRKRNQEATEIQAPARISTDLSMFTIRENAYRCRMDNDFTLIGMDNEQIGLAGYTPEEVKKHFGNRLIEMIYPQDREMVQHQFRTQLTRGTAVQLEHRVVHKSGKVLWVQNKSRLLTDSAGQEYLHCFLMDISSIKATEDLLNEKLARYEIILAQTENVLFEWNLQLDEIVFSDTWEKIFGFQPTREGFRQVLMQGAYFHPDDLPILFDKISNLEKGSHYEMVELRIANTNGRYRWCRIRASALWDENGKLEKVVGIIINIDTEKQAEQVLQDRAERDSLTKLLNKDAGRKRAEAYFQQLGENLHCAMLIIDLDDFKQVNDHYGHLFGDTVLTTAAKEIKYLFRNQDIVSRVGGDEFMVLMRGVSDRTIVENRCKRLLEVFQKMIRSYQLQIPMGCSIGVALAPEHGNNYLQLFKCADQALYQAKKQGKHNYVIYDPAKRGAQYSVTAHKTRIDSDEQPGMADGNIVQYAFRQLYASQDVGEAVRNILAMIGQKMNVSRVYIFENSPDNRFCSNTYEWCNDGIEPQIQNLQNISYETDILHYEDNFDEDGIFYCPDINELPGHIYDILAPQGIKSMLQCAIRENGTFRGYIGFDECVTLRLWTKEQINMLTYFSEMLSVFLLKKQAQDRTAQRLADMSSLMDNQTAWVYIIDPDTCQLKYVNAKTREMVPAAQNGMCCYATFFGRNSRCENCPAKDIRSRRNAQCKLTMEKFDTVFWSEVTLVNWEGREAAMIVNREIVKE